MTELAGSTTKRVSDKRVALEVCDKPWLVFDWEKHGRQPRIELERRRPQGLRHRRPQPGFVAGVHLLDFGVIQSVDLIRGECFPVDHQAILPGLASRRDGSEPSRCFCTRSSSSGVAAGAAAGGAPSARPASALCGSATDNSLSISSSQSILPITSRRARLIWSAARRRHCDLPSNQNQQYQMRAKRGDQQSFSNRKHCYIKYISSRLICFQQKLGVFSLG